jgi:protein-L-isoaspartate O-methyltransferase
VLISPLARFTPHTPIRHGEPTRFSGREVRPATPNRLVHHRDYVPTPPAIVSRMIDMADIEEAMRVLEPSAGSGNIARELRKLPVTVSVCETHPLLRKHLERDGFDLVGEDFMTHRGKYDRIVMNPPFSNQQAATHVRHAFDLLTPGGKLVAIMPEYWFSAKQPHHKAFQEWMTQSTRGHFCTEELPDNTFINDESYTNVKTRILLMEKPLLTQVHPPVPTFGNAATRSGTRLNRIA